MLLTPTYHVFDLYKVHHDAKHLPISFASPDYVSANRKLPAINASASRDSTGAVHITFVNIDPKNKFTISTSLMNINWSSVSAEILTSAMLTDINSFAQPQKVVIQKFNGAKKQGEQLVVDLPAQSVVMVELK